jgi:hypothetical protein
LLTRGLQTEKVLTQIQVPSRVGASGHCGTG